MTVATTASVLDHAKLYASLGWQVLPLYGLRDDGSCYCREGKNCTSPGKHPCLKEWQKHATTDVVTIEEWFGSSTSWPNFPANLGIRLGPASGVIDIETDGEEGEKLIAEWLGEDIQTPTWKSYQGLHRLFTYRSDLAAGAGNLGLKCMDWKLGHGIKGSQSVAPPSRHQKRKEGYQWLISPVECEVATIPDAVVERMLMHSSKTSLAGDYRTALNGAEEGQRNDSMASYIGKLLHDVRELEPRNLAVIFQSVQAVNRGANPPLEDRELHTTFWSIVGRERKRRQTEDRSQKFELSPIPYSQLADEIEEVDWLWEGWLARGCVSLLIGGFKAGKTTMICRLLKDFAAGGELAGSIKAAKVLVISEESKSVWADRDLDVGDAVDIACRPFTVKPNALVWMEFIAQLKSKIQENKYDVLVLDPWTNLNPAGDENSADDTRAALLPLYDVLETTNVAVLLVHHSPKHSHGARGSTVLEGFADVLIYFNRADSKNTLDKRRTLRGLSRFADQTPVDVLLEWDGAEYRILKGDFMKQERIQTIISQFDPGETMTLEDVVELSDLPRTTVQRYCEQLAAEGRLVETGRGVKGDPKLYALPTSDFEAMFS